MMISTLRSCNAYVSFIDVTFILTSAKLLLTTWSITHSHIPLCINHRLAQQEQQLVLLSTQRDDLLERVEALTGCVDKTKDDVDVMTVTSNSCKNRSVLTVT
jgi:hypothetical protein